MRLIIKLFVLVERRTSYTIQENQIIIRIGFAYFLNNALMVLITFRTTSSDWQLWAQNGVIYTVQLIMIMSIFFDALYDLYHHSMIIQLGRRWWLRRALRRGRVIF